MRALACSKVLVLVGALVASCGGRAIDADSKQSSVPRCTPGQQVACACGGGVMGVQRCGGDGTFGTCSCGGAGLGSGVGMGASAGVGVSMPGSAAQSGAGGSTSGSAGEGAEAGEGALPEGRRLRLPCEAPLPTGYCLVSDKGDFIGGGKSSQAGGDGSVTTGFGLGNGIELKLKNANNGDEWSADFVAPKGELLQPGLYGPATRYPFQLDISPGLSISGNGRGCNELTGKFAVEELKRGPTDGLVRFSVTFEQHCEGGSAALRGVVNLQASGTPDPTPTPNQIITLEGKIFRVAYDPTRNIAYGLDASNRRLAKIDLSRGDASYTDVVNTPNDACVDPKRERLFVVNKGSSLITEYDSNDLSVLRTISWSGTDWGPDETRFKIYCAPDRVYVVDAAWSPGLFTIDALDDDHPIVTDHTEQVAGVGGVALTAAGTELYYSSQVGWSAGLLNTGVHRLQASDLSETDVTGDVADFHRDPLDAPLLLDESRGLIVSKNKIFDATNLSKLYYSLPSDFDTFDGATENAYALDTAGGRLATKNFVYELEQYHVIASTVVADAQQMFFDADGGLWFLSVSKGELAKQVIEP